MAVLKERIMCYVLFIFKVRIHFNEEFLLSAAATHFDPVEKNGSCVCTKVTSIEAKGLNKALSWQFALSVKTHTQSYITIFTGLLNMQN